MLAFSVPEEGYSRNTLCTLKFISTFFYYHLEKDDTNLIRIGDLFKTKGPKENSQTRLRSSMSEVGAH
jgi:hypothetical protein